MRFVGKVDRIPTYADSDGAISFQHFVFDLLQILVHARPIDEILAARMILPVRAERRLGVWESLVFTDKVDDVHSVATSTFIQPELDHVMDCRSNIRVLPIQIRLLWSEERKVILVGLLIVRPGAVGFSKDLGPVVRWLRLAVLVPLRIFPYVP